MDCANHMTTAGVITAIGCSILGFPIWLLVVLTILAFLLASVPDVAIFYDKDGKLYDRFHNGDLAMWIKVFFFIYPLFIHIRLDEYCHKEGQKWYCGIWYEYFMPSRYRERMWMETTMWAINLALIGIFYLQII